MFSLRKTIFIILISSLDFQRPAMLRQFGFYLFLFIAKATMVERFFMMIWSSLLILSFLSNLRCAHLFQQSSSTQTLFFSQFRPAGVYGTDVMLMDWKMVMDGVWKWIWAMGRSVRIILVEIIHPFEPCDEWEWSSVCIMTLMLCLFS
jgi:hypothetical protein